MIEDAQPSLRFIAAESRWYARDLKLWQHGVPSTVGYTVAVRICRR